MTDAFPKFQKAPVRWREQTERWREQTETIDAEIARLLSRPWTSADEIEDRRQRFAELRDRKAEAFRQLLSSDRATRSSSCCSARISGLPPTSSTFFFRRMPLSTFTRPPISAPAVAVVMELDWAHYCVGAVFPAVQGSRHV